LLILANEDGCAMAACVGAQRIEYRNVPAFQRVHLDSEEDMVNRVNIVPAGSGGTGGSGSGGTGGSGGAYASTTTAYHNGGVEGDSFSQWYDDNLSGTSPGVDPAAAAAGTTSSTTVLDLSNAGAAYVINLTTDPLDGSLSGSVEFRDVDGNPVAWGHFSGVDSISYPADPGSYYYSISDFTVIGQNGPGLPPKVGLDNFTSTVTEDGTGGSGSGGTAGSGSGGTKGSGDPAGSGSGGTKGSDDPDGSGSGGTKGSDDPDGSGSGGTKGSDDPDGSGSGGTKGSDGDDTSGRDLGLPEFSEPENDDTEDDDQDDDDVIYASGSGGGSGSGWDGFGATVGGGTAASGWAGFTGSASGGTDGSGSGGTEGSDEAGAGSGTGGTGGSGSGGTAGSSDDDLGLLMNQDVPEDDTPEDTDNFLEDEDEDDAGFI
jgi:hypothetical protein